MPRGYYLGQGLIPLGYSSSDDEEGPCELPDGRIVCGPHGLVYCGRCCTDYSDMNDALDEDEEDDSSSSEEDDDEDSDAEEHKDEASHVIPPGHPIPRVSYTGDAMRKSTGKVFPSKFVPSNSNARPLEEFPNRHRHFDAIRRTHRRDLTKVLLMTDGACLDNGKPTARAGWAFFQGENIRFEPAVVTGRLEKCGPWGDEGSQTSNRAELRAVLAALRFRIWNGEGFNTIVIATDSTYVVDGATQWIQGWVSNAWRTKGRKGSGGADVKNKDLWQALLGECERYHANGTAIQFWHIPREWNTLADEGAKKGAAEGDASDRYVDLGGIPF